MRHHAISMTRSESRPARWCRRAAVIGLAMLLAGCTPEKPAPAPDLLGLDQQHTTALLGPAAQTHSQSPATVWHYKSGRCELDLSFYMEMKSGQMRTLHYDFKGEAANPEQRQACLKSIIEENRKPERS